MQIVKQIVNIKLEIDTDGDVEKNFIKSSLIRGLDRPGGFSPQQVKNIEVETHLKKKKEFIVQAKSQFSKDKVFYADTLEEAIALAKKDPDLHETPEEDIEYTGTMRMEVGKSLVKELKEPEDLEGEIEEMVNRFRKSHGLPAITNHHEVMAFQDCIHDFVRTYTED